MIFSIYTEILFYIDNIRFPSPSFKKKRLPDKYPIIIILLQTDIVYNR
jgi:hypothetical protein